MNDNPNTFTQITQNNTVVSIEIFCVSAEAATRAVRLLAVTIAEGRRVRLTLPNPTITDASA